MATARTAAVDDISEVVRLAAGLFESMGMDASGAEWRSNAAAQVSERLGHDLSVFVVDSDDRGRLAACGAGTIATRLPTPLNPSARVGYIQWVATDDAYRRRGYARQILEHLLAWYAEQRVTTIELHSTPDGGMLYRELGFGNEGPLALRRQEPLA
jgi:GNAT superfamily N-acetyltransferase